MAELQSQPYESEIGDRVQQLREALAAGTLNGPATLTTPSGTEESDGLPTGQWGQWANWASWTKVL